MIKKITRKSFSLRALLLLLRMRSKTKRWTMIWIPFLHTDLVFAEKDDGCRHIVWNQPEQDRVMQGHEIRSVEVPHEGSCRVICFLEPNCVSINVRPTTRGGNYICELNNATGGNESSSVLQSKEGHIYVAIEVLRTDFIWPRKLFKAILLVVT